jgi:dolichyl-phosphate-mannose--protein O-mannosyl transferase
MDPFGWRFTTALAGTLIVALTAVTAQLLFGKPIWTYCAGLLLALEHLNVVLSRTAILDLHLELWVVAGFLFLLLDRRWLERKEAARLDAEPAGGEEPDGDDGERAPIYSPIWRPWRFAAGAAFGAAMSIKWSGAMALFAGLVISFVWETVRRRHHAPERSWWSALWRSFASEAFGLMLAFVIVPVVVYITVWLPWMNHFDWDLKVWWDTQLDTFRYHFQGGLQWLKEDPETGVMTPTHPYYAKWWEWVLLIRPISFFVEDLGPDTRQILAIGNPAVFWGFLIALPYTALLWRRHLDWIAGFLVMTYLGLLVPWFFVTRPSFFFYVVPLTPMMVLTITYLLRTMSDSKIVVRDRSGDVAVNPQTGEPAVSTAYPYRPFVWIYLAIAVGMFLWFWPVLTAGRISDIRWKTIVWFPRWI